VFVPLAAVQILLLPFIPYSPRWLVAQNRIEDAKKSLGLIRELPVEDESICSEINSIKVALEEEITLLDLISQPSLIVADPARSEEDTVTYRGTPPDFTISENPVSVSSQGGDTSSANMNSILSKRLSMSLRVSRSMRKLVQPHIFKALTVGFLLGLFQQMSGMNAINKYTGTMMSGLGVPLSYTYDYSIYVGIVKLGAVILGDVFLMHRFGRRTLLMVGTIGMAVCQFTIAGLLTYQSNLAASVVFLFGYVAFYEISVGPLLWIVCGEMFPLSIRGIAIASGSLSCWLFTAVLTQFYPQMTISVGLGGTFNIFGGFCTACLIWGFLFLPETKDKSLEEIEQSLVQDAPGLAWIRFRLPTAVGGYKKDPVQYPSSSSLATSSNSIDVA
jgi:hypothetical protein